MKRFILLLFISCGITISSLAQDNDTLQLKLSNQMFQLPENAIKAKRNFVQHEQNEISKVLSGALIFFYQNVLSEQIQADCTYDTSCSEYLKQCIARYGFLKGTLAGLNQYVDCNSANTSNHAEFIVNENGKVINDESNEKN